MQDILIRAGSFVAIIMLGFLLKKLGVFKDSDFPVLANVTMKITLPAAIITNFANKELDTSMLILIALGLVCGFVYIGIAFLVNLRSSKEKRAFEVLNLAGYNIGCFSMPFVQSFLGPVGVMAACLVDTGNGLICLGGAFSFASVAKEGGKFSFKRMLRTLCKSIPFVCYVIMPVLCLLHVPIPSPVTSFAGIISNANAFCAMLMIGVGFKITVNKTQIGNIARILLIRFGVAAILAVLFYNFLPFSAEIRKTVVLLVFSPISAAVPAFTEELKSDVGLSSALNSIAIVVSVGVMVALLAMLP